MPLSPCFHDTAGRTVYVQRPSAEEIDARHQAFKLSPRGRFVAVVDGLDEIGAHGEEVYKLRSLYNSRITTLNGPVADPAAVGAAQIILIGIGTKFAMKGVEALAELLIAAPMKVAA